MSTFVQYIVIHCEQMHVLQTLRYVQPSTQSRRCVASATSSNTAASDATLRKNPTLYTQLDRSGAVVENVGNGLPQQQQQRRPPEVLSPAGGWPQLQAAVENGADACYFGVEAFNARARYDA